MHRNPLHLLAPGTLVDVGSNHSASVSPNPGNFFRLAHSRTRRRISLAHVMGLDDFYGLKIFSQHRRGESLQGGSEGEIGNDIHSGALSGFHQGSKGPYFLCRPATRAHQHFDSVAHPKLDHRCAHTWVGGVHSDVGTEHVTEIAGGVKLRRDFSVGHGLNDLNNLRAQAPCGTDHCNAG